MIQNQSAERARRSICPPVTGSPRPAASRSVSTRGRHDPAGPQDRRRGTAPRSWIPSVAETWVDASRRAQPSVVTTRTRISRSLGVSRVAANNLFGLSNAINARPSRTSGATTSPTSSIPAPKATNASATSTSRAGIRRWSALTNGRVLAVSGLDQFGQIIEGQTEFYDPATRKWTLTPQLTRTFPTYPALFLMPDGNLFYSGSNAGYGSATVGRTPGIWNLERQRVHSRARAERPQRDRDQCERAAAARAGAALHGDRRRRGRQSPLSTSPHRIADLSSSKPHFKPGPSLAQPTRYPDAVITPDNRVIITGGSRGYRGEFTSRHPRMPLSTTPRRTS